MKFYLYNTDSDGLGYYEENLSKFNVYKNPEKLDEDDFYYRHKSHVIELDNLEDLVKLSETIEKRLVIHIEEFKDNFADGAIEIYDYYRE
ncbi:hypothetical protein ACWOE8_19630 [Enterococcus avium]